MILKKVKKELFFNIIGKFQAKQRPRFNGKFAYTPKETRSYENLVRCKAEEEMVKNNLSTFTGPLIAEIEVLFDIPKSASKKMVEKYKKIIKNTQLKSLMWITLLRPY